MVSPELETLDQLLTGPMPLAVIRRVYPDAPRFVQGMMGLLSAKKIALLHNDSPVPRWRWRAVLDGSLKGYTVVTIAARQGDI